MLNVEWQLPGSATLIQAASARASMISLCCLGIMQTEEGTANPSVIPIPWIHSPVASELGTASLKQPRHDGEFYLME